jgi:hypothetical protein
MVDPFDPDRLRLSASPSAPARRPPPRPGAGERFLKGPIPMTWIEAAIVLPGKALAVGMFLWFKAGCVRADTVNITYARLAGHGLSESTARRGLRALESAGLVTIERRAGRALRVTIRRPATTARSTARE